MMETIQATDTSPARRWVWHSTEQSVANGQISVLAIIETLLSVAIYFWLAQHFERQWWWLLTALAAPILLLRSEASKNLGLQWFGTYIKRDFEHAPLTRTEIGGIAAVSLAVTGALAYALAPHLLADAHEWNLFGRAFLFGLAIECVGIAVAGAAGGVWLRSLGTRITASLWHWRAALTVCQTTCSKYYGLLIFDTRRNCCPA